jgi:hypothetical protein
MHTIFKSSNIEDLCFTTIIIQKKLLRGKETIEEKIRITVNNSKFLTISSFQKIPCKKVFP